jgi:23S rRNA (uracil747-C5)-methyltransferase
MKLNCSYYNQQQCSSCPGLSFEPEVWRQSQWQELKASFPGDTFWLDPKWSKEIFGSRSKAKLAVGGTLEKPILGRFDSHGNVIELASCELHHSKLRAQVPKLLEWIDRYRLVPYEVAQGRGELKYIIMQLGKNDRIMLRFVLRSKESLDRLKKLVTLELDTDLFAVVSANIQPYPKAILEGEEEVLLTNESFLPLDVGQTNLYLATKSFFQTNTYIAGELYQSAKMWLATKNGRFLDLFCGVGGFAAHLLAPNREVIGVELSEQAILAAKKTTSKATFLAMDAWDFIAKSAAFDVVVVNPPRRGLGKEICHRLREMAPETILYSSCNPESLRRDLQDLGYKVEKMQAFEMFPLTKHWEVLVLLTRCHTQAS